jgi:hypothetical protein
LQQPLTLYHCIFKPLVKLIPSARAEREFDNAAHFIVGRLVALPSRRQRRRRPKVLYLQIKRRPRACYQWCLTNLALQKVGIIVIRASWAFQSRLFGRNRSILRRLWIGLPVSHKRSLDNVKEGWGDSASIARRYICAAICIPGVKVCRQRVRKRTDWTYPRGICSGNRRGRAASWALLANWGRRPNMRLLAPG